jgi:hypothetical protein
MNAKAKAQEMFSKYRKEFDTDFPREKTDATYNFLAVQCAIICVEFFIDNCEFKNSQPFVLDFWLEVKTELQNL